MVWQQKKIWGMPEEKKMLKGSSQHKQRLGEVHHFGFIYTEIQVIVVALVTKFGTCMLQYIVWTVDVNCNFTGAPRHLTTEW